MRTQKRTNLPSMKAAVTTMKAAVTTTMGNNSTRNSRAAMKPQKLHSCRLLPSVGH
jgi:hypothetical protein